MERAKIKPKLKLSKLGYRKERAHRCIVRCKRHFDKMNHLFMEYDCDRQTDRWREACIDEFATGRARPNTVR